MDEQLLEILTRVEMCVCPFCEKKFSSSRALNNHKVIHTKEDVEEEISCSICGRLCKSKSGLTKHMLTHKDDRLFTCPVCGKSYTSKGSLTRHMILHSDERPYKCQVCAEAFQDRKLLNRHLQVHGDYSYKCRLCNKAFINSDDLSRHEREIHSKELPERLPDFQVFKNILKKHTRDSISSGIHDANASLNVIERNDPLLSSCAQNEVDIACKTVSPCIINFE